MASKTTVKEIEPIEPTPQEACFIGRRYGTTIGAKWRLPNIYNAPKAYFDKDGQVINTTSPEIDGKPIDQIGAVSKVEYEFEVGDIIDLPVWDEVKLEEALSLAEFAKPEAQEKILTAHNEAYAASEARGGDLAIYNARIEQLVKELCEAGLLLKPASGKFGDPVLAGCCGGNL